MTYAGFMLKYEFGKWNKPELIMDIALQLDFPLFERQGGNVNKIEFITDSSVYCEMLGQCGIFDINTGLIERRIQISGYSGSINISNKKRYIFFADAWYLKYMIYDIHENRIVHSGSGFAANHFDNGVGILDDSHELIGSFNVSIERFDFINNQHKGYFAIYEGQLAFSPDNKYLHSYDWSDFKIDIQTGEIVEHQNSSIIEYNNTMTQYVFLEYNKPESNYFINIFDIEKNESIRLNEFITVGIKINPRFSDDDKF
jgi:hypothetical protein